MKIFAVIEVENEDAKTLVQDILQSLISMPDVNVVASTTNLGDLVNHNIEGYKPLHDEENWRCIAKASSPKESIVETTEGEHILVRSTDVTDPFEDVEDDDDEKRPLHIIENKKYLIYHCTGPDAFTEVEVQPRRYAGFVEADCLTAAFALSQNRDNTSWYPLIPCRSTSIGDIVQDDDKFFMVDSCGFRFLQDPNKE